MQSKDVAILLATEGDLGAVSEIELLSNLNQWGIENHKSELLKDGNLFYVAKNQQMVAGFIFSRLITPVVEIFNIAVHPHFRKQGIGEKLFKTVLERAIKAGCKECWLEVRESNEAAIRFYEKLNFKNVGRRKKYYQFPTEDALLLEYKIDDNP